MALLSRDLKLLDRILSAGHVLEKLWPMEGPASDEALRLLQELRTLVRSSERAESPDLTRLAFHETNLTQEMSLKHLSGILVPFERLRGKALRDDEFLVAENDANAAPDNSAPLQVIVDNIRSAFNVGAILRTAECFGVEEVVLTGYTPTPDDEKTAKTSMGSADLVKWSTTPKALDKIEELKAKGYTVVALETAERAEDLGQFTWPEKCALVLGNERFGIDRELLAASDRVLRIPLHGRKNSLNVGIAFGIAAADWRRKLEREGARTVTEEKSIAPIGVFHSPARHPYEARRQGAADHSQQEGWIELSRGHDFQSALQDLSGFERIWLLYRFDRNSNWKPKVLPPRGPNIKRGVFATRSPYRPNPIGLSCVRLERIEGLKVYVTGFDLLDQTPVYDIKPYIPYADAFPNAHSGWLEGIKDEAYEVRFASLAEQQLVYLESNGVDQARGFIQAQLEYAPLDHERKRVSAANESASVFVLAYRTWRAEFALDVAAKSATVNRIYSGYSEQDLLEPLDKYQDKDLHRIFSQQNWKS